MRQPTPPGSHTATARRAAAHAACKGTSVRHASSVQLLPSAEPGTLVPAGVTASTRTTQRARPNTTHGSRLHTRAGCARCCGGCLLLLLLLLLLRHVTRAKSHTTPPWSRAPRMQATRVAAVRAHCCCCCCCCCCPCPPPCGLASMCCCPLTHTRAQGRVLLRPHHHHCRHQGTLLHGPIDLLPAPDAPARVTGAAATHMHPLSTTAYAQRGVGVALKAVKQSREGRSENGSRSVCGLC
jgi:hypothetical protein